MSHVLEMRLLDAPPHIAVKFPERETFESNNIRFQQAPSNIAVDLQQCETFTKKKARVSSQK